MSYIIFRRLLFLDIGSRLKKFFFVPMDFHEPCHVSHNKQHIEHFLWQRCIKLIMTFLMRIILSSWVLIFPKHRLDDLNSKLKLVAGFPTNIRFEALLLCVNNFLMWPILDTHIAFYIDDGLSVLHRFLWDKARGSQAESNNLAGVVVWVEKKITRLRLLLPSIREDLNILVS